MVSSDVCREYVNDVQELSPDLLVEVVEILLKAGAAVDYVSPADASAMSLAIANKHEEVMKLLVAAGAGK